MCRKILYESRGNPYLLQLFVGRVVCFTSVHYASEAELFGAQSNSERVSSIASWTRDEVELEAYSSPCLPLSSRGTRRRIAFDKI